MIDDRQEEKLVNLLLQDQLLYPTVYPPCRSSIHQNWLTTVYLSTSNMKELHKLFKENKSHVGYVKIQIIEILLSE